MSEKSPYSPPSADLTVSAAPEDIETLRKNLIPKWIKFFGWIFIVFGVLAPIAGVMSIIFGVEGEFALYGLNGFGSVLSPIALTVLVLFAAHGICAYGLLFAKQWGVISCLILGYISIAICLLTMLVGDELNIRIELLVLIPYLMTLHKIKKQWLGGDENI